MQFLFLFLLAATATAFAPPRTFRFGGTISKEHRLMHRLMRRSTKPFRGTKNTEFSEYRAVPDDSDPFITTIASGDASCEVRNSGTQSQLSTATNLAKCMCGAGSFALPHVFLEEGILGGTIAISTCGILAAYTMQSLAKSKAIASEDSLGSGVVVPVTSYVELAENALGPNAAKLVFTLTLCASIGVCSTYLVFIGQTLESLSSDAQSMNVVRQMFPDVSTSTWEACAAVLLYPLSLLRSYGIFAFTSALGVAAVLGGILVTLASGIFVDPGGGIGTTIVAVTQAPMWPTSFASAFGGSFGTIAYLFCINFLTFPIMNSIKVPNQYSGAVNSAAAGVWIVNVIFAALCVGFYGNETQDLVLGNLDNGPYLSALKLLLCVDLLFTFPIVFSSGRQILENALIGADKAESDDSTAARAAIAAGAVGACFGLAQIGGFGAVANLVGGVAQGTLAFIMPPAIAVALARRNGRDIVGGETGQLLLGVFGVSLVSSVTYFTVVGMIE
jgi:proton-coupled amino acid transporter